jgi:hypothetical protein
MSSLTIWNKRLDISSMNSKSRLTNQERNSIRLTPRIKSILVGLLISDGWITKRKSWNARIGFKQSIINFNYLWSVFSEISVICSNFLYLCKTIKRRKAPPGDFFSKLFYAFQFKTRQLHCLNELFDIFYNSETSKKTTNIKQI